MPPTPPSPSLLHRIKLVLKSPTLSNTGSTARDHLASERTFLAWLRTGLGFIALGVAVERFSQLQPALETFLRAQESSSIASRAALSSSSNLSASSPSPPSSPPKTTPETQANPQNAHHQHQRQNQSHNPHLLPTALLTTGTFSLIYGTSRYFATQRHLSRGVFKPAYLGAAALSVAVSGIAGEAGLAVLR
ncbi:hypothetical protein K402DRAFT_398204 [Aulographum hederae CBS 113979]|uniref:DUF202 domain-containing protein n=1 Tax=Aulographum hederae CBS 113979 TaxID=1176131 RepID=A0A6G1GLI6_9PEZI|nr:hypothetical protein K402DRAFT_398204 [Aulographum hederae CBS 113979]